MILEDLYYGSLHPNERIKPNDPELQSYKVNPVRCIRHYLLSKTTK